MAIRMCVWYEGYGFVWWLSIRLVPVHSVFAIRAFIRLEVHRLTTDVSWYGAQTALIRDATRAYLAHPTLRLSATA
jgi:hypothetical protein